MNKLKLEVGKSYRTRNGKKVTIETYLSNKIFPFIGKDKYGIKLAFKENGKYANHGLESEYNIIEEWQDEPAPSILQEAENLINGDRAKAYGDAKESFENIAKGWSVIFGKEVTARQVGLAMAWLKICRENNNHKLDNLVDLAGYAALIERL